MPALAQQDFGIMLVLLEVLSSHAATYCSITMTLTNDHTVSIQQYPAQHPAFYCYMLSGFAGSRPILFTAA